MGRKNSNPITPSVKGIFSNRTLRLGVTGLSGAGKTVFITSLIANLLQSGRMLQFSPVAQGRLSSVYLQPQPDDTVPRFQFETHYDAMLGANREWPQSTRKTSELRLSFQVQPWGLFAPLSGPKTVHLDIIDYPGEWLLDLALLQKDYATWSAQALAYARQRGAGGKFCTALQSADPIASFSDVKAEKLAEIFTTYLKAAQKAGHYDCTPGRFILPGDMEGSPALTFAPLPYMEKPPKGSFYTEMERRYNAYKSKIVKPFFRDHFSKIDCQIVLVDLLAALANGPQAVADLEKTMGDILQVFKTGRNRALSQLIFGKRVERVLFAATKADHLHRAQHANFTALTDAVLQSAKQRAEYTGAQVAALSIGSLRTTVETQFDDGRNAVQGWDGSTGKPIGFYAGTIPGTATKLLAQAHQGAAEWEDSQFTFKQFAVPPMNVIKGKGPPHIRLDTALEFLVGHRFG